MEKATLIYSLTTWVKIIDITQNQWINVSGINWINWVICTQAAWNPLRLRADWVCRNPWSCCFSQTQYQVLSEWLEMHNHTDAKAQTKWAAFISLSRIAYHWIILETDPKKRLQEAIEWTYTPQRCDFHVAMLGRLHSNVTAFHSEMKNEALHLLIMFKNTMFCPLPHEMIWEV